MSTTSGIFPSGGVPASDTFNADPDIVMKAGCTAKFYSARCNVRFDQISMNGIISEIGNVANCGGLPYDCERQDNLCTGIQGMINNTLTGCLPEAIQFPSSANACTVKYLTVTTDGAGCRKLAEYTQSGSILASARNNSAWGNSYPRTMTPTDSNIESNLFYWYTDLGADVVAGTVNFSKLIPNKLLSVTFTMPCSGVVELKYEQLLQLDPKRNLGNGATSIAVMSIDGVFILQPDNQVKQFGSMTNFISQYETTATVNLTAGIHTIDVYITGFDTSLGQPGQVIVVGDAIGTGAILTVSKAPV